METIEDEGKAQAIRNGHGDEQGGKQVEKQQQQQERPVTGAEIVGQAEEHEEQSQIRHDWSKIETAISSLSNNTLDDCVKRLNELVFNKIYKAANDDISIETFDNIMTEIDDEVKRQDIDKHKSQYDGKEIRQFISQPVIFVLSLIFQTFVLK